MNITDTLPPWGLVALGQSTMLSIRPITQQQARNLVNKSTRGHFSDVAIGQLAAEALSDGGSLFDPHIEPGDGMISVAPGGDCLLVMSSECHLRWFRVTRHESKTVSPRAKEKFADHLKVAEKASSQMALASNAMAGVLDTPEAHETARAVQELCSVVTHAYARLAEGLSESEVNEEIWLPLSGLASAPKRKVIPVGEVVEDPAIGEAPVEEAPAEDPAPAPADEEDPSGYRQCKTCGGTGTKFDGPTDYNGTPCPDCGGKGEFWPEPTTAPDAEVVEDPAIQPEEPKQRTKRGGKKS